MIAYLCTTSTTDLLRTIDKPLINHISKEYFADFTDLVFNSYLRFIGIQDKYPTAVFKTGDTGVSVLIDGVVVYSCNIVGIDTTPVEIAEA